MTTQPLVSVVMGAYNGEANLQSSVQSVLSQEGADLELIIVDDGSTDSTPGLLRQIAESDHRVRILRQDKQGLTRALILGCAHARGKYIARQDCGDSSLSGRLIAQVDAYRVRPEASLVSCGARFVGPQGEVLYEVSIPAKDADEGLRTLDINRLRGPAHHGATLYRRDLYEQAGGYRKEFYFAQDLDLWSRLIERGPHVVVPGLYYEAELSPRSISGLQRAEQVECARLVLECARLRRAGGDEGPALLRASEIRPRATGASGADLAAAMYFIGTCLRKRGDPRARRYFREALRASPFHLKSAMRLLLDWHA